MYKRTNGEKLKLLRLILMYSQEEFRGEFPKFYLALIEEDKEMITPTVAKYYIDRFRELAKENNLTYDVAEDFFEFEATESKNDCSDDTDVDTDPDISIFETTLSNRVVNALFSAGIKSISKLKGYTDRELIRIQGIGKGCIREIREYLEQVEANNICSNDNDILEHSTEKEISIIENINEEIEW